MNNLRRLFVAVLCVLFTACSSQGQGGDITISDLDLSDLKWGEYSAPFELTNHTDYLKFVIIETEVRFDDSRLKPVRLNKSNLLIEPMSSAKSRARLYIPPNYGAATIEIRMHDVVDTLDDILPGQKFFDKTWPQSYPRPEAMNDYLALDLNMPPRVENHPDFDNDFCRSLFLMLDEGKPLDEIADLTGAQPSFVGAIADYMAELSYLKLRKNEYKSTFPVILAEEVSATMPLIDRTAGEIASAIEENQPKFYHVLDSLILAGSVSRDRNEFMNGGTLLYHPYPTICGLVLWSELGRQFITRSAPLLLYDATDPCNAHIPFYMYLVQGGAESNGYQFFYLYRSSRVQNIYFGDSIPGLECGETLKMMEYRSRNHRVPWKHGPSDLPEVFMNDTVIVRPALNALCWGTEPLLSKAYNDLKVLAIQHGHDNVSFGHRYWFWNLVAGKATDQLIDRGVIKRRGNGQFRFDSFQN